MSMHEDCPDFDPSAVYAPQGDAEELRELAFAKMPYGKYAGRYLVDLPEQYLIWFENKGFPNGRLGEQMAAIREIQMNGLEHLLRSLHSRPRF